MIQGTGNTASKITTRGRSLGRYGCNGGDLEKAERRELDRKEKLPPVGNTLDVKNVSWMSSACLPS
jgi:hypothetical protein